MNRIPYMLCNVIYVSIKHFDYFFILYLYSLGFSIYYMNFANTIHKIFIKRLYRNNVYINPGFFCGLFVGSLIEYSKTQVVLKSLFYI